MTLDKDVPIAAWMTRATHTVRDDATLGMARKLMLEQGIRHLPVIQEKRLIGVLSERDVHLARAVLGERASHTPVADICAPVVYAVPPSTPLFVVAGKMADERYGAAVVVDEDEHVIGIFTTTDACRALSQAFDG